MLCFVCTFLLLLVLVLVCFCEMISFVFVFGFVDDFFSFSQAHDDFEARTGEAYVSSVVNF